MILQLGSDLPALRRAILMAVLYADIFDYPLTLVEIHRYMIEAGAPFEVLAHLMADDALIPKLVQRSGDYYSLPGRESIITVRMQRQQVAARLWPKAVHYGRMIAALPFIRMTAVT